MVQPLSKTLCSFLKKIKIKFFKKNKNTISLLGIYSKELKAGSRKDICISMSVAALFTIAKTWKQPKCPRTDQWIRKMIWKLLKWNLVHMYC